MNNDAVSGIVKIVIEKKDYQAQVEMQLRQYRQKAEVPGFRKGMVPLGMLRKLYGKNVMANEVEKCVLDNLTKYIRENDLRILGNPLSSETEQKTIDFDTQEDFEFYFDLAFSPQLDIKLNKRDKLNYYIINVDDEMLQQQIDSYRRDFGSYDMVEDVEETDLVKGTLSELDENGAPREGGILVTGAVLMPMYLKDDERTRFVGAKLNDIIVFNPDKAYGGATAEIAMLLRTEKEHAAEIKSDFSFEVQEITRHREAELNQEFYDRVFGPDAVQSEEAFREKVKLAIERQLNPYSEQKFQNDMRALLIKKTGNVTLAEDILKRWLRSVETESTPEQFEEDFPKVIDDLKFNLAKDHLIRANSLEVEPQDVMALARQAASEQLASIGIPSMPDDILDNFAKELMSKEKTVDSLVAQALQNKVSDWIKTQIKIETKEIPYGELEKLLA
jgi:trigger factor